MRHILAAYRLATSFKYTHHWLTISELPVLSTREKGLSNITILFVDFWQIMSAIANGLVTKLSGPFVSTECTN